MYAEVSKFFIFEAGVHFHGRITGIAGTALIFIIIRYERAGFADRAGKDGQDIPDIFKKHRSKFSN